MSATQIEPGDRVYRWYDSGALGMQQQPLTVVRVNSITVTVRTDQGSTFRLPWAQMAGRYEGDCETDCQDNCSLPGEFSECSL